MFVPRGVPRVFTEVSDGSCCCCMTSLGKPSFRSAVAWFCVEMESVVELLVLWCYGVTKSWIRLASLSQPDVNGECPVKLPVRLQTSKVKSEDERERARE